MELASFTGIQVYHIEDLVLGEDPLHSLVHWRLEKTKAAAP